MQPTYIIGIGGTGMKIGHILKRILHENNIDQRFFNFRFFESDNNEVTTALLPLVNNNHDLLDPARIKMLTGLNPVIYAKGQGRENTNRVPELTSWLDDNSTAKPGSLNEGLKGERPLGRLVSYHFCNQISSLIASDISNLRDADNNAVSFASVKIFVIASICGGTGSSNFFDLVTLLCHHTADADNIQTVLVMPNYYLDNHKTQASEEWKRLQINTWAFYKELKFFVNDPAPGAKKRMGEYFCKKSQITNTLGNTTTSFRPYGNALLFDYILSNNSTLKDEFFESVANLLYININAVSSAKIKSGDLVNAIETGSPEPKFNSMGYATLKYPKREFEKYFVARGLYDVFRNKLLNEEFDDNTVVPLAEKFTKHTIEETLFQIVSSNYTNRSESFTSLPKSNPSKDTPFDGNLIKGYLSKIETYEKESNGAFTAFHQSCVRYFDLMAYEREKHVLHSFENELGQNVNQIISMFGFVAAVGTEKLPHGGYIDHIEVKVKELFNTTWEQLRGLNNEVEKVKTEIAGLITTAAGKKRWDKVDAGLYSKIKTLKESFDHRAMLNMRLSCLYMFAAGFFLDSTQGRGENYRNQKKTICSNLQSRINAQIAELRALYSSGTDRETDCIKNAFEYKLPAEFTSSSSSPFIIHIPRRLSEYHDGQGWIPGTDIDNHFNNHLMGVLTLTNIFGDLYPFSDPAIKVKQMKTTIEHFINAKLTEIDELKNFTTKDIPLVYENLTPQEKLEIRNRIANIVSFIKSNIVPASAKLIANVPTNCSNKLMNLITALGEGNAFDTAEDARIKDETEVVFAYYTKGYEFPDLERCGEFKYLYENRDMKLHRPHIYSKWNDKINGPDAYDSGPIMVGEVEYSAMDVFTLCFMLDIVKDSLKDYFISNKISIATKKLVKTPCLPIAPANNGQYEIREFDIAQEDSVNKLAVSSGGKITGFSFKKPSKFSDVIATISSMNNSARIVGYFTDERRKEDIVSILKEKKNEIDEKWLDAFNSLDNYVEQKKDQEIDDLKNRFSESREKINEQLDNFLE